MKFFQDILLSPFSGKNIIKKNYEKKENIKKNSCYKTRFFGWVEDDQNFLNMFSDSLDFILSIKWRKIVSSPDSTYLKNFFFFFFPF